MIPFNDSWSTADIHTYLNHHFAVLFVACSEHNRIIGALFFIPLHIDTEQDVYFEALVCIFSNYYGFLYLGRVRGH